MHQSPPLTVSLVHQLINQLNIFDNLPDHLHVLLLCLLSNWLWAYILKAEGLEVRTPQIIWIFRKIILIVWERQKKQLCQLLNFVLKSKKMCPSIVQICHKYLMYGPYVFFNDFRPFVAKFWYLYLCTFSAKNLWLKSRLRKLFRF